MKESAKKQNNRPFSELRSLLRRNDYTTEELSRYLGKSRPYVSQRLNGKHPWDLDDVYKILDWLYIPYKDLHIYFPKGGRAA